MADFIEIPIANVKQRPELFQYRQDNDGAVDRRAVDRMARRWNWGEYDPIDVAHDPRNPGQYVVIAGHHRATAAGELAAVNPSQAREKITARVHEGNIENPEELNRMVDRAISSNYGTRKTSLLADTAAAKKWREQGHSAGEIAERMNENRTSKVEDLLGFGSLHQGDQQFVQTVPDFYPAAAELGRAVDKGEMTADEAGGILRSMRKEHEDTGQVPNRAIVRNMLRLKRQASESGQQSGFALDEVGSYNAIATMQRENDGMEAEIRKLRRELRACDELSARSGNAEEAQALRAPTEARIATLEGAIDARRKALLTSGGSGQLDLPPVPPPMTAAPVSPLPAEGATMTPATNEVQVNVNVNGKEAPNVNDDKLDLMAFTPKPPADAPAESESSPDLAGMIGGNGGGQATALQSGNIEDLGQGEEVHPMAAGGPELFAPEEGGEPMGDVLAPAETGEPMGDILSPEGVDHVQGDIFQQGGDMADFTLDERAYVPNTPPAVIAPLSADAPPTPGQRAINAGEGTFTGPEQHQLVSGLTEGAAGGEALQRMDGDADNDGLPDFVDTEQPVDTDPDKNDNGLPDFAEPDAEHQARMGGSDPDANDNNLPDFVEPDAEHQARMGGSDPDANDNGLPDFVEPDAEHQARMGGSDPDANDNNLPDFAEPDAEHQARMGGSDPDANDNGLPDFVEPDAEHQARMGGSDPDANDNNLPDFAEPDAEHQARMGGSDPDANDNGLPDFVEPDAEHQARMGGSDPDANDNNLPDFAEPDAEHQARMGGSDPDANDNNLPDFAEPDAEHIQQIQFHDGGNPDSNDNNLPDFVEPHKEAKSVALLIEDDDDGDEAEELMREMEMAAAANEKRRMTATTPKKKGGIAKIFGSKRHPYLSKKGG